MRKLFSLLLLTGTLFMKNNIFTLNPSVNSAGMGNVGTFCRCEKCISQSSFCGLKQSHQEISYVDWLPKPY